MATIEYSTSETAAPYTSSLPAQILAVEGDTTGKWWVCGAGAPRYFEAIWIPSGSNVTRNLKRALGVQEQTIDTAMEEFLFDDGSVGQGGQVYVAAGKP